MSTYQLCVLNYLKTFMDFLKILICTFFQTDSNLLIFHDVSVKGVFFEYKDNNILIVKMSIYNTVNHSNIHFTYFTNDAMAENSIGLGKRWEPHMTNFVQKMKDIFDIKNVIDVGANFGYNSIYFSKILGDDGKVFAFEPQLQNYELLVQNVKQNDITNIVCYNNACSHVNGEVELPLFELPLQEPTNMGDITPNYKYYKATKSYTTVKSVRLDNLNFPKIDLIKIDVQGWEINVIDGLQEILLKDKPVLIVEFEHFQLAKNDKTCQELADIIRNYGYYIYYLDYEYPSDHVCVHQDFLKEFDANFQDYISQHNEYNSINFNILHNVNKKIKIPFF